MGGDAVSYEIPPTKQQSYIKRKYVQVGIYKFITEKNICRFDLEF